MCAHNVHIHVRCAGSRVTSTTLCVETSSQCIRQTATIIVVQRDLTNKLYTHIKMASIAATAHADGLPVIGATATAVDTEVPLDYDEDYDEAFHGPEALQGIGPEEYEDSMVSQWDEGVYTQHQTRLD